VRGSSQLEGYHSHLGDALPGTNYSSLLAGALLTFFNYRYEHLELLIGLLGCC
jgi:hypothetical protein